jgi:hypothetical protein
MSDVERIFGAQNLTYLFSIKYNRVLSLPLLGGYGSRIAFEFNKKIQSMKRERGILFRPENDLNWFYSVADGDHIQSLNEILFKRIFRGLNMNPDLEMSPYDLPAILAPVENYFAVNLYSKQFSRTLQDHMVLLNSSVFEHIDWRRNFVMKPEPFKIHNYFGKYLGPHLKAVMEVMYHCMLRTRSITRRRYTEKNDLYQDIENFMMYPIDLDDEPFNPSWDDYKSYDKTPYWYGMFDEDFQILFENNPEPRFNSYYHGDEDDPNADGLLERLRQVYQQQMFIVKCTGPGEASDCSNQFYPVLTENGICYTFNGVSLNRSVVSNTYTNMFTEIFDPNHNNSALKNKNSGKSFSMFLVLDSHFSQVIEPSQGSFKVAINSFEGNSKYSSD